MPSTATAATWQENSNASATPQGAAAAFPVVTPPQPFGVVNTTVLPAQIQVVPQVPAPPEPDPDPAGGADGVISPLWTSAVRTVVPYLVGLVVAFAAKYGFTVNPDQVQNVQGWVTIAFGTLYYVVVRRIEMKWPKAGWLLGSPKKPVYGAPK